MTERRQFFRKTLNFVGCLTQGGRELSFRAANISIRGLQAMFEQDPALQVGDIVRIDLPILSVGGIASVVWARTTERGEYLVGLTFERLDGIGANFYQFRSE